MVSVQKHARSSNDCVPPLVVVQPCHSRQSMICEQACALLSYTEPIDEGGARARAFGRDLVRGRDLVTLTTGKGVARTRIWPS